VRFSTHFFASLAGYALPLFLVSFFGQKMFDIFMERPATAWIGPALAVIAVAIWWWVGRRRRLESA
jgi:hypothetical protein